MCKMVDRDPVAPKAKDAKVMSASAVHPSASIAPSAKLAPGVKVGAFAVVGDGVELGDDCVLAFTRRGFRPVAVWRGERVLSILRDWR